MGIVDTKINGSSVYFRDVSKTKSINSFEQVNFTTNYQSITGNESIGIYVNSSIVYEGIIIDQSENDNGTMDVRSVDKTWKLKDTQVQYTEIAYNDMTWTNIVDHLLVLHTWCNFSTTRYSNVSSIPHIHFVHASTDEAIRKTMDLVGYYPIYDYENSELVAIKKGDLNTSADIVQEYIGEIDWETDYSEIYNFIYIKGGRENGSAANDYITEFDYDGTSLRTYGKKEYPPYVDEELINRSTCKLMASYLKDKYKDPIINGRLSNLPYRSDYQAGYTVNISNSQHDGEYLIQYVSTDFEKMTSDVVVSNSPVSIENEIRDIQNDIELLKKHAMPLYTDNKLIWVTLENMRRTTSLTVQETEGTSLIFPFNFNGVWGGFKIFDESIHRI